MSSRSRENFILNSEEIRAKKRVLKSRPVTLDATLTTRCNLKCRMCGVVKKPWDIPSKTFNEIMELLPYLNCTTWQGGEAFLYPGFKKLLNTIHRSYNNIEQTIYTNALLLDDEWMKELVKGPKTLFLSIDAVEPKLYEKIRRGAKFKELLQKIELINKYKLDSSHRMDIYINAVIMRSNYRNITDFIEFGRRFNVAKIEFSPVEGNMRDENIFRYPDKASQNFLARIRPRLAAMALEKKIEIFNRLPYKDMICDKDVSENIGEGLYCTLPWTFLFILAGGKVIPHGSCKKIVGDINSQSIMEIWNGKPMQKYRQLLAEGNFKEWCGEKCHWMDII